MGAAHVCCLSDDAAIRMCNNNGTHRDPPFNCSYGGCPHYVPAGYKALVTSAIAPAIRQALQPGSDCVPRKLSEFYFGGCVPPWPPEWRMGRSTIVMPCNYSGFVDPVAASRWGVVEFDWSGNKLAWANERPMNDDSLLAEQARRVKDVDPSTKVTRPHRVSTRTARTSSLQDAP